MRKSLVLIIISIILASFMIVFVEAQEYGEDSQALGQHVDDYTDDGNVSVTYQVINNQTLDVMELNQTAQLIRIKEYENGTRRASFQFREHRIWGSTQVLSPQEVTANDFRTGNTGTGYRIAQWFFITVNREWLDGKYVRFRWYKWGMGFSGGSSYTFPRFRLYDGEYNRSSFDDFPVSSQPILKGSGGQMDEEWQIGNVNVWYIKDLLMDTSSGNQTYCTLMWADYDYTTSLRFGILMDYIQINSASGGSGNIWMCDFESDDHNLAFELYGTYDDYGLINGTQGYYEGGYYDDGYYTTTDYLDNPIANGTTLVHMINATLESEGTITVQYSDDNSTWVDNHGVSGYSNVPEGMTSFDLRDLNYSSSFYARFNLSKPTQRNITPRIYQSRLITTIGNSTGVGNGETIYVYYKYPILLYGIGAFMIIIAIVAIVSSKRRW